MQQGNCLGSTALHGEELISFLEGYGSVTNDVDFFEDYDDTDDVSTHHRSYPLQYSNSVPRKAQPMELHGRLVLRGRAIKTEDAVQRRPKTTTNPFDTQEHNQFHGTVNIKKKTHYVPMFRIRSRMPFDTCKGWRHFFSADAKHEVERHEYHLISEHHTDF